MHISLDSALGRQRRLNSVGESVLQIAPDAAAAYSLRSLTGGDPDVVRVRRESDNTEKDFSGSQIESGEMARWVNEQPTLPLDLRELDTNTGERDGALIEAAAAYSLRKLKEDFTGDVVEVRRNVDGETEGFTADEVTDGTLESFVNASFDDELPLDQATGAAAAYSLRNLKASGTDVTTSGDTDGDTTGKYVVQVRRSSDDAVKSFTAAEVADGTLTDWVNVGNDYVGYARFQDTTTANVNLSSSFTLEATKSWSIKFGYIGGENITGLFGNTAFGNGGFWFANSSTIGLTDDSNTYQALSFGTGLALNIGQHYEIEFFNTPSEGVRVKVDGTTMVTSPKIYGDITIDKIGLSRGRDGERVIHNVRVDLNGDGTLDYSYAGDGNQASNWVDRVGNNNGTPTAQVLTYNNDYTDGHVKTWYDQSGSDNHATQTDTASQPKIVDGGNYLGEIDFDGSNHYLDLTSAIGATTESAVFSVAESGGGTDNFIIDNRDGGNDGFRLFRFGSQLRFNWQSVTVSNGTLSNDTKFIGFGNHSSSVLSVGVNGESTTSSDSSSVNVTATPRIGARSFTSPSGYWDGTMNEIIIYNSDQSDKRRAIEENIANHYDITLAAFSRDGTVSTWYDQSGSTPSNDAVQTDAAKQPKIVLNGSLVQKRNKPSIKFADDSSDERYLTSPADIGSSFSFFASWQPLADDVTAGSASAEKRNAALLYGTGTLYISGINADFTNGYRSGGNIDSYSAGIDFQKSLNLHTIIEGSADINYFGNGTNEIDGSGDASTGTATQYYIGSKVAIPTHNTRGYISELIHYNSDQSDNRTAIEANIGETYGITDIPAANDTVNGYVQTWYDQSGSVPANDAVQSAAADQPKIVNEGTLIDSGILFSGGTQNLETSSTFSFGNNPVSVFSRLKLDSGASGFFLNLGAQRQFINVASGLRRMRAGVNANCGNSTDETEIWSVLFNPVSQGGDPETFAVNGNFYVDGVRTSIQDVNIGTQTIGDGKIQIANRTNETDGIEGAISEVIVYDSDQSSNRPDIEENIESGFKEVNLWLTGGQSNSVGIQSSTSNVTDSSYDSDNEINMIAGGWVNTHVYANDGYPTMDYQPQQQWIKYSATNNSGPDRGFARRLAETYDNVRIAKFAVNGKDLDRYFKKSGSGILNPLYQAMIDQFNDAISKLRAGGYKVNLRGFFWSHGYSDSDDSTRASNYETNLNNFISDIRNDLKHVDAGSMPFLVAKNAPFWTTVGDTTVETAKSNVASADSNVELVDTSSLTARDVTVHYDAASYEELGKRAADVFTSNF